LTSRLLRYLAPLSRHDEAQRLFHGRGRQYTGLEHVTIDWLPPVALITLFKPEPSSEMNSLALGLREFLPECSSIQVQHRYHKHGPVDLIWGADISQWDVVEAGLTFRVTLGQARNTGLFLDMRVGRQWVRNHSGDKRVLNLFAYTCGFSVAAVAGGARSVVNVDLSGPALSVGRENHRLNGGEVLPGVSFEKLDIFKSFGRLKRRGPFDLLICDPPTFQKGSVDIAKDYPKVMRRLDQLMAPGGCLLLCLNAIDLGPEFLIAQMSQLAPQYILTESLSSPPEFVEAPGCGLKILVFEEKTQGR